MVCAVRSTCARSDSAARDESLGTEDSLGRLVAVFTHFRCFLVLRSEGHLN